MMMAHITLVEVYVAILVVFGIWFIGFVGGSTAAGNTWRKLAIKHRSAEWVVDPKTGETQFRWFNAAEEEKS